MIATPTDARLRAIYDQAAAEFFAGLPMEHFMESTPHATQRAITVESFHALGVFWPDVQCFNELLLQYPIPGQVRPGQVVPDNMIVVHPEPIAAGGSYNLPDQPVGPLVVVEYVSARSEVKDYRTNLGRYEAAGVPYYLIFDQDTLGIALLRRQDGVLERVAPDAAGRVAIPEIELEIGLLDGWMRYWHDGELLPVTAEVVRELDAARTREADATAAATAAEKHAAVAEQHAIAAEKHAIAEANRAAEATTRAATAEATAAALADENARLRAELARLTNQPGG